jgi:phosphate-selective porin O/P
MDMASTPESTLNKPVRSNLVGLTALLLVTLGPAQAASAFELSDDLKLSGHAQLWFSLHEQMEDAGGLTQFPSGDEAATSTSGFSLNRARLGVRAFFLERLIELATQLRLEKNVAILDLYLGFHFCDWLQLYFGQFKVPAPRETLSSSGELDFIFRPVISELLVDYSLSRTTYASSLFYGVHSYLRDFGIGLKGELDIEIGRLRYFLMIGNGLGANLFISGNIKKEYILTNSGQFFYGLRVEAVDLFDLVTIGGHINYNYHDNMVFNSGRVVYDLKRVAYSGDITLKIPKSGLRLSGLYGQGEIFDDFDDDQRTDLTYSGWECRLMWRLNDLLARYLPGAFWDRHVFEIGARFDHYQSEWNESGAQVTEENWTIGVNYLFSDYIKVQLNYVIKNIADPSLPDLDDNILLLSVQGMI